MSHEPTLNERATHLEFSLIMDSFFVMRGASWGVGNILYLDPLVKFTELYYLHTFF